MPGCSITRRPARELAVRRADHLAGDIRARNVRKRDLHPLHAAALPEIEVIERAGAHADQSFARAGDRIGGVFVPEHVGPAMRVKTDGFHSKFRKPGQTCKTSSCQRCFSEADFRSRSSTPVCGPSSSPGSEPTILSKSPTISVVILAGSRYRCAAARHVFCSDLRQARHELFEI